MTDWPKISAIISDLDGVTYRGDDPIESAVDAFQQWNKNGFPYAFVTNNSTKSAEEFADKLNGMGIPASPERIITTSAVAADRLAALVAPGSRVMVIGATALRRAVEQRGFEIADEDVAAVVAGLDRAFTFEKLARAQTALMQGARFIGTNPDHMLPHGGGFEPGAGSILKAIETASGVAPLIIGKPEPDLVTMALAILGTDPASTYMLGDQIMTDIMAGHKAGLPTILVRTGVAEKGPFPIHPDFDIETLAAIPLVATQ
ncbi:HAD-IIA family hydrolase [Roseovarius sp. 2305UL8-3]|uniref:HAD-IIA family hydrolase n=1 Tax=Roseovarius conchicola TaxID=3121636 RepID=UPI003529A709